MNKISHHLAVVVSLIAIGCSAVSLADDNDANDGLSALVALLGQVDDVEFQLDLLKGMHQALRGRRNVKMPDGWSKVAAKLAKSKNETVRRQTRSLSLVFGDQRAIASLRKTMFDTRVKAALRGEAIQLLVENGVANLAPELQRLVKDPAVRGAALRGLSAQADPETPKVILQYYASLTDAEKTDAIHTLTSRRGYAGELLDAVEQKKIPASDISAFEARQLQNLGDAKLTQRLEKLWGAIRQTSQQKRSLIAQYKKKMTADSLQKADLSNGRLAFQKTCQQCHTLYGEGGKIGPDITGSNRNNLDYILENILAPSVAVPRAYRVSVIAVDDGRIISGIAVEQTNRTLTVQTVNEKIVLDRETIEEMQPSPVSMMPDGLFDKLSANQIRDLIAYLATKQQVTLPPGANQSK